jgi:uncharacterized protein DUF397
VKWRKSSRSGGNNGANCVEVAADGAVYVRDSKDPEGSRLIVSGRSWAAFLASLKR